MCQSDVLVIRDSSQQEGEILVFELLNFKTLIRASIAAKEGLYKQNRILKDSFIKYPKDFKEVMHYHLSLRKNVGAEVEFIDLKDRNGFLQIKLPFSEKENGIVNIFSSKPTIFNNTSEIVVNWKGVVAEPEIEK